MQSLRFSKNDIEDVRCVLAAILHLGNVKITGENDGETSRIANVNQVRSTMHVSSAHAWMRHMYRAVCVVKFGFRKVLL